MESDKVVVKSPYYQGGVDKSIIDFDILGSVKVTNTKVVSPLYKEKGKAYIGIKDALLPNEKIKLGAAGILYFVKSLAKKVLSSGGYLYEIKRVDGANITQFDIDQIQIGSKVKITTRRTFNQMMYQDGVFNK